MKHILFFCILFQLATTYSISQNRVVINILDRTKGESRMRFIQRSIINTPSYSDDKEMGQKIVLSDSTFKVVFEPFKAHQLIICSWLKDNKQILLTPGDSMNVAIDYTDDNKTDFNVTFKGGNEKNYSFERLSHKIVIKNQLLSRIKSSTGLKSSISIIDSIYASNISTLQHLPNSMYNQVRINEEKASFFNYLFYATNYHNEDLKHNDVLRLMDKIFTQKIECPRNYLMNSQDYVGGIYSLNRLLCNDINSESILNSSSDTIKKYFVGELRDYLLSMNFSKSYFENQKLNVKDPELDNYFNTYYSDIKDSTYKKYLVFIHDKYKKQTIPLPSNVLNERVVSLNDSSTISIGELLSKYKGKHIIIDHWATWCGACINEINIGKTNTEEFEKDGVEFIYISLDNMRSFNEAKQKSIDIGINIKTYILPENFNTEYVKYFKITNIPRYVLIDTNGNIKNLYLTRPSQINSIDSIIK